MTDLVFGAVKASSRKGELLTNQQIIDLAGSRDLKDLLNRVKDRYPFLATASPSLSVIEEGLLKSYKDELGEFMKVTPELAPVLMMVVREVDEVEVVNSLKAQMGISTPESAEGSRRGSREDVLAQIAEKGFATEVKDATEIYEKYKVPALIDAVFARQRLLNLAGVDMRVGKDVLGELNAYIQLKIDVFNVDILLRGIKNEIDRKALAEVIIFGGSIPKKVLQEGLKQKDIKKVLSLLESTGLPKVESPRALERYYESRISRLMNRTYYSGYVGAGTIMGYIELKYREIRNIIRVANAISLGIDPKRLAQDFIF